MNTKRWIVASLAVFSLAMTLQSASAQTRVAILDVGKVFKNHPQFKGQLDALKQEAEQFKAVSVQQQQALMKKGEALKQYEPGSAEYRNVETQLAQESAAMEVQQRDKMRDLMRQEAELHYGTYQQVNNAVASYCEQRGIQLVLRYNSLEMDAKNPTTIMQKVNGSVVFHDQRYDITSAISDSLKQSTANAGTNYERR